MKNKYKFYVKICMEVEDYNLQLAQEKLDKIKFILPANSKITTPLDIIGVTKEFSEELVLLNLTAEQVDKLELTEYQYRMLSACATKIKITDLYEEVQKNFKFDSRERFATSLAFLVQKKYLVLK